MGERARKGSMLSHLRVDIFLRDELAKFGEDIIMPNHRSNACIQHILENAFPFQG
jgi:hypothetical protein